MRYPAELFPYDTSSTNGTYGTLDAIHNFYNQCSGKIVLLGYSQGAQVVGDVMCGGGGAIGEGGGDGTKMGESGGLKELAGTVFGRLLGSALRCFLLASRGDR